MASEPTITVEDEISDLSTNVEPIKFRDLSESKETIEEIDILSLSSDMQSLVSLAKKYPDLNEFEKDIRHIFEQFEYLFGPGYDFEFRMIPFQKVEEIYWDESYWGKPEISEKVNAIKARLDHIPPFILDGGGGNYYVSDGNHRMRAFHERKIETGIFPGYIPAFTFQPGTGKIVGIKKEQFIKHLMKLL